MTQMTGNSYQDTYVSNDMPWLDRLSLKIPMEGAVPIYLKKMHSHHIHLTSKQLPAHSPPSTDRNTTPAVEIGGRFPQKREVLP